MRIARFIWDSVDDPEGNVQHIAEHGLTVDDVETVLIAAREVSASRTSGRPIVFGEVAGKSIAVVFEIVERSPLAIYPVTAYEITP